MYKRLLTLTVSSLEGKAERNESLFGSAIAKTVRHPSTVAITTARPSSVVSIALSSAGTR